MKAGNCESHKLADESGATSCDALKVLREWQRDWARKDTYDATIGLVQGHSGAYGKGVD
jgi:hypothetical protein